MIICTLGLFICRGRIPLAPTVVQPIEETSILSTWAGSESILCSFGESRYKDKSIFWALTSAVSFAVVTILARLTYDAGGVPVAVLTFRYAGVLLFVFTLLPTGRAERKSEPKLRKQQP